MKLIILGGGFGGLRLANLLSNKEGIDITLIDRFNYHQFQPLFYQVATAGLDASNISFPLRKAFQKSKNVRIRMAEVERIDTIAKQVITNEDTYSYDYLVIATGASTNFFGNKNLEEHAFPMKSTVEALQLRHKLIHNFEDALHVSNKDELQRLMNVVVVGGGPTGVELSGAIAEMKKYVLPKDYPELDFSMMNIYLLEGTGKTLAAMSEQSSANSLNYLQRLGVTVMTNSLLQDYDGKNVTLKDGTVIPSALVIWAAGIKGNIPAGIDPSLIARGNRIKVDEFNFVQGLNNVFAIGDIAYMEEEHFPDGHPQVAPVAIQQATLLAANLLNLRQGKIAKAFRYKDKGAMATVGRNLAVVDVPKPKLHFGGFFAWLIWMGLHLMLILGVKNRFFVFTNWLYNYFTYDQSLRLIFKEFYRREGEEKGIGN
ncbi:NAD(P)/FAD-dependent oxidoreductase [Lacibacter sediminis]|uniref:NADH:ubiquinone reductase (non-electrogenic) n=1 Tax=Lacibacter sediminis TaxID=2760713 RepID=A0A7G5XM88_9BACT|nr:NAD(P)/FAD-dependent oxidoreductase [Lacibacter sediminis]QNA46591.1 NAD(P)/FAD-dependent oxidoreductase [Lacibacter sediminis]